MQRLKEQQETFLLKWNQKRRDNCMYFYKKLLILSIQSKSLQSLSNLKGYFFPHILIPQGELCLFPLLSMTPVLKIIENYFLFPPHVAIIYHTKQCLLQCQKACSHNDIYFIQLVYIFGFELPQGELSIKLIELNRL